ncbi:hypothetical protein MMC25_005170 [Agyrium rufum]|nr:hypothetical protein [Agyrium rufum]
MSQIQVQLQEQHHQQQQQQQHYLNYNLASRQGDASYSTTSFPSPSLPAYAYPPPESLSSDSLSYPATPLASNDSIALGNLLQANHSSGMDARASAQEQNQHSQQVPTAHSHQQPPPPGSHVNAMASSIPPGMNHMPPGYYQHTQHPMPPHSLTDPNHQPLRYPLPEHGMMGGQRPQKKEIKRRTKTGCLTCRKRRIKCDEAHPLCRNCQKSKRECLGYDPIFKTQPGPAVIQPAPSSASSMQSTSATTAPYHPPPPQGYTPASSQTYSQPAPAPVMGSAPEPFDYNAAIDPALAAGGPIHVQSHPSHGGLNIRPGVMKPLDIHDILHVSGLPPPSLSIPPLTEGAYHALNHVYGGVYAAAADKFLESRWFSSRSQRHVNQNYRLCEQFTVLLSRFTLHPSADYTANAVTQSLEATIVWDVLNLARVISERVKNAPSDDLEAQADIRDGVHEAAKRVTVIEKLITNKYVENEESLPAPHNHSTPSATPPSSTTPGQNTSSSGTALENQLNNRERNFWYLISKFLTLKDDTEGSGSATKEIDDTLSRCRLCLDSRENRDVLYSIAIARYVGSRMYAREDRLAEEEQAKNTAKDGEATAASTMTNGEGGNSEKKDEQSSTSTTTTKKVPKLPLSDADGDAKDKLNVATMFISDQANGKGTTQVVQRVCGMVLRAWAGGAKGAVVS